MVNKRLYVSDAYSTLVIDYNGKVVTHLRPWFYLDTQYGRKDMVVFGEQLVRRLGMSLIAVNKHIVDEKTMVFGKTDCDWPMLVHPALQPQRENKCAGSGCDGLFADRFRFTVCRDGQEQELLVPLDYYETNNTLMQSSCFYCMNAIG